MLSARAESLLRSLRYRRQLAAVGVVLGIVAMAIVVGAAMTRQEPENPEFPQAEGMVQIASGSMPITMFGLDHEDARSDVFTAPGPVADIYAFYTQDVTAQGWTLVSGVEDADGSAVVYLTRYDSVAMVQIMDAALAGERQLVLNPRLNINPADLEDAETLIIVGRFRCTDESGTAVCLDYIIQGQ